MPGFNYRMTELQAAIGKVQLSKLDFMLKENKKRYDILFNKLNKFISIRTELSEHKGSYDTFILSLENEKKQELIIKKLIDLKFGTKNLPDAMEWHCSHFWSHAISNNEVKKSKDTFDLLTKQIAIPILLKKSLEDYKILAQSILNVIN